MTDGSIMLGNKSMKSPFPKDTMKSIKKLLFSQSGKSENNWPARPSGSLKAMETDILEFLLLFFQTLSGKHPLKWYSLSGKF